MVAVFLQQGQYFAIDDLCPHMGASLADGYVEDGVVSCPWHAWRFRVCDGTWCDNPKIKIDKFEVRVVGEEIQVGVALKIESVPDLAINDTAADETDADAGTGDAGDD